MKTLWIILGMMVVTYLPRLLPGLLIGRYRPPPWFETWLKSIPYAALGALILPGLLKGESPVLGAVSGVTAIVLSLLDLPLIIVMAGTVCVAAFTQYLS
jgi:branched-subunit amino acid transport protein